MPQAGYSSVVEIDVGDLDLGRQAVGLNSKAVVVGRRFAAPESARTPVLMVVEPV